MHLKQPVQKRLIEFQDECKKNIAKVAADRVSSAVKQSKLEEEARAGVVEAEIAGLRQVLTPI